MEFTRDTLDGTVEEPGHEFRATLSDMQVLELFYSGEISASEVLRSLDETQAAVAGRSIRIGLVDTRAVTKIRGDIHGPSQKMLAFFKASGMEELVLVMSNPIVRMIVRATSLVTGLRTRGFDTMPEAQRYVRSLHREKR